eukprot:XP_011677634.1 PREDICTED: probable medium-chain specific acyl-CoA dehydrogenase, mitochondrial [Strongylocentrotus purpuratus]
MALRLLSRQIRGIGVCGTRGLSSVSSPAEAATEGKSSGLSFALSEEQLQYQDLTRKFTAEEIIPKAAELDRSGEVIYILLIVMSLSGLFYCMEQTHR